MTDKKTREKRVNGARADVIEVVRRAAMMAYVHAKHAPRLDEMATELNAGITPSLLDTWRKEDDWDARRADAIGLDALEELDAERRRLEARMAVENIHLRALRVQQVLKPKTWEAAAGVQLRCAETLRQWAEDDGRRFTRKDDSAAAAPAVVDDVCGSMSEEQWQQLAHAALSGRKENAEDGV